MKSAVSFILNYRLEELDEWCGIRKYLWKPLGINSLPKINQNGDMKYIRYDLCYYTFLNSEKTNVDKEKSKLMIYEFITKKQ